MSRFPEKLIDFRPPLELVDKWWLSDQKGKYYIVDSWDNNVCWTDSKEVAQELVPLLQNCIIDCATKMLGELIKELFGNSKCFSHLTDEEMYELRNHIYNSPALDYVLDTLTRK